jgi:hypothetical protein
MTPPPSLRTLEGWSARGQWQRRLEDLDRRARGEVDRQHLDWLRDHRERLLQRGRLLQELGTEWLEAKRGDDVKLIEAIRALETGFKLEALALSETMNRTAPSGDKPRFEALSDAEWTDFVKLVRAVFGNYTVGREPKSFSYEL